MKIEINNGIEEVWVPLLHKGFEETHEVSNLGRIRSYFYTRKHKTIPYVVKTNIYEENNILVARVYNDKHTTMIAVAYETLKAFGFSKQEHIAIAYKDGIRSNCSLNNLYFTKRVAAPITRAKKESTINKPIHHDRSCKMCAFYKCFKNQDDGNHFKTDYAKIGCFKYKQAV